MLDPRHYFLLAALVPGHLLSWGIEWAFASATTVAGIWCYPKFAARYPRAGRFGLLALCLLTTISLMGYLGTALRGRFPTGVRDVVDLLKPAMIYFSCTLGLSFASPSLAQIRNASFVMLSFGVVCGLLLIYGIPGLASVVDLVYGSTKTAFWEFSVRVSIPFENPNFLGLLAVLSLIMALHFEPADLKLAAVSLLAAGLSGSRTAWITAALVVLLYCLRLLWSSLAQFQLRSIPMALAALALPLTAAQYAPDAIESYQRLANLVEIVTKFDLSADSSYAERIALRENASDLIATRPLVGWGAIKYTDLDIVDNQYFSLLLRFGVAGSIIVALSALALLVSSLGSRQAKRPRASILLLWAALAAWLWNGTFLENIRLAILIVLVLAAVTSARRAGASTHA